MSNTVLNAVEDIIGSGIANPIPSLPSAPTVGTRMSIIKDTVVGFIVDSREQSPSECPFDAEEDFSYHPGLGWYLHDKKLKEMGIEPTHQLRIVR